jgi:hypothetical protein
MVRVIYVDGRGQEAAEVELDDFTVKTLHPGIAEMLENAVSTGQESLPRFKLSKMARPHRAKSHNRPRG